MDSILGTMDKFGVIVYNCMAYYPIDSQLVSVDSETGIEFYSIKALPTMYMGFEPNRSFGGRYCTYVPYEYHTDSDGTICWGKDPMYGFKFTELNVASYQPLSSEFSEDWCGRKVLTRITYAGKTHNLAMGAVKREMKRQMLKVMELSNER